MFKAPSIINANLISYGCVNKLSNKSIIQGFRVETIDEARNEYKTLLVEWWEKLIVSLDLFLKMVTGHFTWDLTLYKKIAK